MSDVIQYHVALLAEGRKPGVIPTTHQDALTKALLVSRETFSEQKADEIARRMSSQGVQDHEFKTILEFYNATAQKQQ